jgi:hypothetical protein
VRRTFPGCPLRYLREQLPQAECFPIEIPLLYTLRKKKTLSGTRRTCCFEFLEQGEHSGTEESIVASSPEAGAILASSPEAGAIVPGDHLLKYVLKPPGRRRTSSEATPHGTKVHVNRDGYIKGTSRDGIRLI